MARAASPDAARWTAIRLTGVGSPARLELVRQPRRGARAAATASSPA